MTDQNFNLSLPLRDNDNQQKIYQMLLQFLLSSELLNELFRYGQYGSRKHVFLLVIRNEI